MLSVRLLKLRNFGSFVVHEIVLDVGVLKVLYKVFVFFETTLVNLVIVSSFVSHRL